MGINGREPEVFDELQRSLDVDTPIAHTHAKRTVGKKYETVATPTLTVTMAESLKQQREQGSILTARIDDHKHP